MMQINILKDDFPNSQGPKRIRTPIIKAESPRYIMGLLNLVIPHFKIIYSISR